jgi:hypothetical protein
MSGEPECNDMALRREPISVAPQAVLNGCRVSWLQALTEGRSFCVAPYQSNRNIALHSILSISVISVFRREVAEKCALLGYYAAISCKKWSEITTIRRVITHKSAALLLAIHYGTV